MYGFDIPISKYITRSAIIIFLCHIWRWGLPILPYWRNLLGGGSGTGNARTARHGGLAGSKFSRIPTDLGQPNRPPHLFSGFCSVLSESSSLVKYATWREPPHLWILISDITIPSGRRLYNGHSPSPRGRTSNTYERARPNPNNRVLYEGLNKASTKLVSKPPPDGQPGHDIQPKGLTCIGSYNWIEATVPSIIVPGEFGSPATLFEQTLIFDQARRGYGRIGLSPSLSH